MDQSNVISIKSKKPLSETKVEEEKAKAEQTEIAKEALSADIKAHLEAIDGFRKLVEKGEVMGIILLGRHTKLGLPYQDVIFPTRQVSEHGEEYVTTGMCPPEEAFFYTGLLEAMKLEFADMAQMAPCIGMDGSVMTPQYEEVEMEE